MDLNRRSPQRSREQSLKELADRANADDLHVPCCRYPLRHAPLGHEHTSHPHICRLGHAALHLRYRSHLASESNFADEYSIGRKRPFVDTGRKGGSNCEISAGLLQPNATDDIEKNVERGEGEAGALIE